MIASRKFVLTAKEKNWKCFQFSALDLEYARRYDALVRVGVGVWPPVWYPEGVEPHPNNQGPMPEVVAPDAVESGFIEVSPESRLAEGSGVGWVPQPVDDEEAGEPTGHMLLGEPVRWFHADGVPPEVVTELKNYILYYLPEAVEKAVAHMNQQHDEAEEEDDLEIWGVQVEIAMQPDDENGELLWELHISASNAGPCPSHFLVFRRAELTGSTAAD